MKKIVILLLMGVWMLTGCSKKESASVSEPTPIVTPAPTEEPIVRPTGEPTIKATPEITPTLTPTLPPTLPPVSVTTPEPVPTSAPATPQPTPAATPELPTKPAPEPEVHTHSYTAQTKAEATCTSAKILHDVCICGATTNERTDGEALGHVKGEPQWINPPDCTGAGMGSVFCTVCSEWLETPKGEPLGHSFIMEIINPDRDCKTPAEVKKTCTVCGWEEWEDDYSNPGAHVYVENIYEDYDLDKLEWYTYTVVECKCGARAQP